MKEENHPQDPQKVNFCPEKQKFVPPRTSEPQKRASPKSEGSKTQQPTEALMRSSQKGNPGTKPLKPSEKPTPKTNIFLIQKGEGSKTLQTAKTTPKAPQEETPRSKTLN